MSLGLARRTARARSTAWRWGKGDVDSPCCVCPALIAHLVAVSGDLGPALGRALPLWGWTKDVCKWNISSLRNVFNVFHKSCLCNGFRIDMFSMQETGEFHVKDIGVCRENLN